MDINSAFPSKYLKASDLRGRPVVVTMDRVEIDKMQDGKAKPVLYFAGTDKGLVLNKTNSRKITSIYGSDTERWAGGKIELYPTSVEFSGDTVDAIRVRAVSQQQPAQRAPASTGNGPVGRATQPAPRQYSEVDPPPAETAPVDLDDEIPF